MVCTEAGLYLDKLLAQLNLRYCWYSVGAYNFKSFSIHLISSIFFKRRTYLQYSILVSVTPLSAMRRTISGNKSMENILLVIQIYQFQSLDQILVKIVIQTVFLLCTITLQL